MIQPAAAAPVTTVLTVICVPDPTIKENFSSGMTKLKLFLSLNWSLLTLSGSEEQHKKSNNGYWRLRAVHEYLMGRLLLTPILRCAGR